MIEKVGSTNLDPSGTSFYELLNSNWAQVLLFGISLIAIGLSAGIALRLLRGQKLSTLLSSGTTFAWMIFIALHVMASIVSSPLDDAVLVEPGVVRSGPGDHFLRLFSAPAGMRVILKDEMQTDGLGKPWVQILSGEDQIGWIQESILLPLSGAWVRPRERKLK